MSMKINYEKLKELNLEAITNHGEQMSCYYVILRGVERYLNGDTLTDQQKELLIDLGVLIESEEGVARKNIVGPFKFSSDGTTNS